MCFRAVRVANTTSYASSRVPLIVVRLPLHATGRGLELLSGFEDVIGLPLANVIAGGDSTNSLFGGGGADHLLYWAAPISCSDPLAKTRSAAALALTHCAAAAATTRWTGATVRPGTISAEESAMYTCLRDPGDVAVLC